jgi:hypothetical protein
MLLPLGILASASGGADYELISTTVLGSSQAQVDFSVSAFSGIYKHLQIRMSAVTAADKLVQLRLNNDTGGNYSYHGLEGNGSGVDSFNNYAVTSSWLGYAPLGSTYPTQAIIEILDAYSTSKNTTIRTLFGSNQSSGNRITLMSGGWYTTAAVSTISIFQNSSAQFAIGSRFSVYGLKG